MKPIKQITIMAAAVLALNISASAQKVYESRDSIPAKYKWALTDIYKDHAAWEADFKKFESEMKKMDAFKGKLKASKESLLSALKLQDELGLLIGRLYRLPKFQSDLDTRDQAAMGDVQKVSALWSEYATAVSWVSPEILEIPEATLVSWIKSDKKFAEYRFGLESLLRSKKHVLSADKEMLLSYFSRLSSAPSEIYTNLTSADFDYPKVKLSTGEELPATYGNYYRVVNTFKSQDDRKKMYDAHYETFKKNENTINSVYSSVCQSDWANAQARNYTSSIEAALDNNNVPLSVYENLISTVKANAEPLRKYHRLRKKVLGLDKYYSYDGSVSITSFDKNYPFEDAQKEALASVAPMGKEYVELYKKALSNGWVDVFETKGKRSGAYSAGVYGVHPYMLLNYNGTMEDMFTLAHEMGHTMHTLLSDENQPYATSNYTIFVAEVASTFNEAMLLDHILKGTKDPRERIQLLQQQITNIVGTFYLQTLFADYEYQVHKLVDAGEPVTPEVLNNIVNKLNKDYYGDCFSDNPISSYVWARIPHFYHTPFYVYQYATCFASSAKLFENYKKAPEAEKSKELGKLLTLLKSGGDDYPIEQLKKAGVDLTDPKVIKAVADRLDMLVTLLEQEYNKLDRQ